MNTDRHPFDFELSDERQQRTTTLGEVRTIATVARLSAVAARCLSCCDVK
jgi:hypothetical protein